MRLSDVHYRVRPATDTRLVRVLSAIEASHVNGGAVLRIFEATDPSAYETARRTDLQGLDYLLGHFLKSACLRTAAPELRIRRLANVPDHVSYGAYEFDGAITQLLLTGGAYVRPEYPEDVARSMSREFVDALLGEHRLQALVFRSYEPWTSWFFDLAWDVTVRDRQPGGPRLGTIVCNGHGLGD